MIETIGNTGYGVQLGEASGSRVVEAICERTGERFVVRAKDTYAAAVELAGQLGFDLADG